MKKLSFGILAGVLCLSGCTSTDGQLLSDVGTSLFTQAVDNRCRSELNESSTYKTVSILMSETQKRSFEDKACGCVAEEAPKHISVSEMGQAVIDSSARTQIVGKAVANTLGACVKRFFVSPEATSNQ